MRETDDILIDFENQGMILSILVDGRFFDQAIQSYSVFRLVLANDFLNE